MLELQDRQESKRLQGPGEEQHAEGRKGPRRRESREESACRGKKGAGSFMVGCGTLGCP